MRTQLTVEEIAEYRRDGFVMLRNFYELESEIHPVQRAISKIIHLVRNANGLSGTKNVDPEHFDIDFLDLVATDRSLGSVVYDAVKQIPSFIRLVCSEGHEMVYKQLRGLEIVGVAGSGYGVRIDIPNEERFRADWHQEYPAQLRSLDGAVFWSPLVPVEESLGPVRICVGSHVDGLVPVFTEDSGNPEKIGPYALVLSDREGVVSRYPSVAPTMEPGDLLIMDFLTIHASGFNVGRRARWSMQSRLFNYEDLKGRSIGWTGSFAAGGDFRSVHPELVADQEQGGVISEL